MVAGAILSTARIAIAVEPRSRAAAAAPPPAPPRRRGADGSRRAAAAALIYVAVVGPGDGGDLSAAEHGRPRARPARRGARLRWSRRRDGGGLPGSEGRWSDDGRNPSGRRPRGRERVRGRRDRDRPGRGAQRARRALRGCGHRGRRRLRDALGDRARAEGGQAGRRARHAGTWRASRRWTRPRPPWSRFSATSAPRLAPTWPARKTRPISMPCARMPTAQPGPLPRAGAQGRARAPTRASWTRSASES